MKLRYYKRSAVISVSCNESQVSEAKRVETCWTNYPTCEAKWDYINILQFAVNLFPKLAFIPVIHLYTDSTRFRPPFLAR